MNRIAIGLWASLHMLAGLSPLEKYRRMEFPPTVENFDKGWKERVALEFDIVNHADLKSLHAALKDEDHYVRAMSAHALGIRGDKASAEALAELARTDPEPMVRMRAVSSLGLLKLHAEVIELAKQDPDAGVCWEAKLAAGQAKSNTDYSALLRQGYAAGIKREAMGSARVGQRAPDFVATTSEGESFKLSKVLGKKPIALYFAAFDG